MTEALDKYLEQCDKDYERQGEEEVMKHWEWLRNAPDWVQGEFAQEFEQLEKKSEALQFGIAKVRDSIDDRTHGATLSECEDWYSMLGSLLK